jgi:hypothetical protein
MITEDNLVMKIAASLGSAPSLNCHLLPNIIISAGNINCKTAITKIIKRNNHIYISPL